MPYVMHRASDSSGANRSISDCCTREVLHLRSFVEGPDFELWPGYYVLREVLCFGENAGVSFGVVAQVGEDSDGGLIVDGNTHLLPRHALEQFVGTGLRAREAFSVIAANK